MLIGTPGNVVKEPDLDHYNYYKRYRICKKTCKCIKNAITEIEKNPGQYCVLDPSLGNTQYHCATFAIEVLKKCGIDVGYKDGDLVDPGKLKDIIDPLPKPPEK